MLRNCKVEEMTEYNGLEDAEGDNSGNDGGGSNTDGGGNAGGGSNTEGGGNAGGGSGTDSGGGNVNI